MCKALVNKMRIQTCIPVPVTGRRMMLPAVYAETDVHVKKINQAVTAGGWKMDWGNMEGIISVPAVPQT